MTPPTTSIVIFSIVMLILICSIIYNLFINNKSTKIEEKVNTEDMIQPIKELRTNFKLPPKHVFNLEMRADEKFIKTLNFIRYYNNHHSLFYLTENLNLCLISKETNNEFEIYYNNNLIGIVNNYGVLIHQLINYSLNVSNSTEVIEYVEFEYKTLESKIYELILSNHDELRDIFIKHKNEFSHIQKENYNKLLIELSNDETINTLP